MQTPSIPFEPSNSTGTHLSVVSFAAGVAAWTLMPLMSVVVVWITGSAGRPYWPFFWPAAAALMAVTSGHLTRQESGPPIDWRLSLSTTGLFLGYIYLGVLGLMQGLVWLFQTFE